MIPRIALAAALLVLASPGLQARELPPAPGEPRDFRLPGKTTVALENGLAVTFIEYGNVPKVTVLAVVRTGNIDDGEQTWLSDVTAEMMKEGTRTRSARDLALAAARMGGSLSIGAGAEQFSAGLSVLSEHADQAVALVADVLRDPLFPEQELPRIIANFERSLSVARSSPGSIASAELARLVYGDHPFGRAWPEPAQLASYSIADVRRFHADNFGAVRTHLYIAGRFDRASLERAIREAFGDWQPGPPPTDNPPQADTRSRLALIDRPDAPQTSLRMATVAPGPADADYFPFTLMNTLLGGGSFSARITQNLREDKGYTYSPYSSLNPRRGAALWTFSADVTTEHTADSLTEVYREIRRLQDEAPSSEELEGIKSYRAGIFVVSNSSPDGMLGQLAFMDLYGLPDEYLTSWVANMYAVTPQQVSLMARRWIDPTRMAVVVVGDLAQVAGPVEALPELDGALVERAP